MAKRKPSRHLEDAEQTALVDWVDALIPVVPALAMLYAVPNGGSRAAVMIKGRRVSLETIRLKRMGLRPGVFDIALDVPARKFAGLRIEMKAGDGSMSAAQREWLVRYRRYGYCAGVAWSWTDAAAMIVAYLSDSPAIAPSEISTLKRALPWGTRHKETLHAT